MYVLPKSLKRLVLSSNMMNLNGNLWNRLSSLINLEELIIDNQNTNSRIRYTETRDSENNKIVQIDDFQNGFSNVKDDTERDALLLDYQVGNKTENNTQNDVTTRNPLNGSFKLPPNLRTVNSSMYIGFGFVLLNIQLHTPNKLQHLNFSSSFLTLWGSGYLPKHVQSLDMSHNLCNVLSRDFFPENNSLVYLDVKYNYLGVAFSDNTNGDMFSSLKNLEYLDVSSNNIFNLHAHFVKELSNLKTLIIRENKLRVLNLTLKGMDSLDFLDVSKNAIHHITKQTLDDIDEIVSKRRFTINLQDNSIPCTCDGLPLLHWILMSKARFLNRTFLTCINEKGDVDRFGDLQARVRRLESVCQSKTLMYMSVSFLGTFICLFIAISLVYKQRWKIRYFKNLFVIKYLGFQPTEKPDNDFTFDAYVVYDKEDADFVCQDMHQELERKRGHRLCFEDKDFLPGTIMTNNITCAIQTSTVTLFVVSPASIVSSHVEYAIQMAIMEEYYSPTERKVLHLVLYKDTQEAKIPMHLLALLKKERYTELPSKTEDNATNGNVQQFWDQLSSFIGHTNEGEQHQQNLNDFDIGHL